MLPEIKPLECGEWRDRLDSRSRSRRPWSKILNTIEKRTAITGVERYWLGQYYSCAVGQKYTEETGKVLDLNFPARVLTKRALKLGQSFYYQVLKGQFTDARATLDIISKTIVTLKNPRRDYY